MPTIPASITARFEPLAKLGEGAMGAVAKVRVRATGELAALKIIGDFDHPTAAERFRREAAALSKVRHPNVLRVIEHGASEGVLFLVTELLEGHPMDRLPPEVDPLPALLDVGRGLDAVHAAGVLHRDLKPANMFRTQDGRGVLLDFGLVQDKERTRLTATGQLVGTARFVAPELLVGRPASPASDWYSWGVSLYLLLEREHPYTVEGILQSLQEGVWRAPAFHRIPEGDPRAEVLQRLLVPNPGRRLHGADAVARLLEAAAPPPALTQEDWTLERSVDRSSLNQRADRSAALPALRSSASTAAVGAPVAARTLFLRAGAAALGLAGLLLATRAPTPPDPPSPAPITPPPSAPAPSEGPTALEAAERLDELHARFTTEEDEEESWQYFERRVSMVLTPEYRAAWAHALNAIQRSVERLEQPDRAPDPTTVHELMAAARATSRSWNQLEDLEEDLQNPLFVLKLGPPPPGTTSGTQDGRARAREQARAALEEVQDTLAGLGPGPYAILARLSALTQEHHPRRDQDIEGAQRLLTGADLAPTVAFPLLRAFLLERIEQAREKEVPSERYLDALILTRPFLTGDRGDLTPGQAAELHFRAVNHLVLLFWKFPEREDVLAALHEWVEHSPALLDRAPKAARRRLAVTVRFLRKKLAKGDRPDPGILPRLEELLDRARNREATLR